MRQASPAIVGAVAALIMWQAPLPAEAQWVHRLSLDSVVGLHNTDTVYSDQEIVFRLRVTTEGPYDSGLVTIMSHRFRIYSPSGAEWQNVSGAFAEAITDQMFYNKLVVDDAVTGGGVDTIKFLAGGGFIQCGGLPEVFDEVGLEIAIGPIDSAFVGGVVCMDSLSTWFWDLGWCDVLQTEVVPDWDGPHCFTVKKRPCIDPFTGEDLVSGDANHDGIITAADLIYIVNYVFKGGEPDACWITGDANCTGTATSADIIYLVNYVFKAGPAPCNVCSFVWNSPELLCQSVLVR